jgi:hypothetical protein
LENEFGCRIEDEELIADNFATPRQLDLLLATKTPTEPIGEAKFSDHSCGISGAMMLSLGIRGAAGLQCCHFSPSSSGNSEAKLARNLSKTENFLEGRDQGRMFSTNFKILCFLSSSYVMKRRLT